MPPENELLDKILLRLLAELPEMRRVPIPESIPDKRRLLRCLMNVRPAVPLDDETRELQDAELQIQAREKGRVEVEDIPVSPRYPWARLWQGDITRLAAHGIVNAANSALLGCFEPLHGCIDNAIHSAAGMQLREACGRLMRKQGHEEPAGQAKITSAYNLPARYVLHTVGPIVHGLEPTVEDARLLASCYDSCLELAAEHELQSLAFCCISTGVFRYPQEQAAKIAVETTAAHFAKKTATPLKTVIFNVFTDKDLQIYRNLLS